MSFIFGSPGASAPTLDASTLPAGQAVGASGLPGAPTNNTILNTGITLSPGGGGAFGFRSPTFDPNNLPTPADVTFASSPVNTAGLFGSVPTAGWNASGVLTPPPDTSSTSSTPSTSTTATTTDDALNRLIDLAAQQAAGGGGSGGGGVVALPTGIADTGTASSGSGISPVAILIVGAIVAGALWYFHKKHKKGEKKE